MNEFVESKRVFGLGMATIALLASVVLLWSPGTAQAANGSCTFSEGGWACSYVGNSWPADVKLWFEAAGGENERHWNVNYAYDGYGGSVYKCAGFKSYDGGEIPQACGTNNGVFLGIPSNRDPGWVYIVQHAGGARNISGYAVSG